MKTFQQFMTEVYDKDVMDRSQIKQTGEGGLKNPREIQQVDVNQA